MLFANEYVQYYIFITISQRCANWAVRVRVALKSFNQGDKMMTKYERLQADAMVVRDDSRQINQDFAITDWDFCDE